MKKLFLFCLTVFFINGVICPAAESDGKGKSLPVKVSAAVDKPSILIGDKITYTIMVRAKKDIEVEFPEILPEDLAGFSIKDHGSSQKGLFGLTTFKHWYLLDTYASGTHTIGQKAIKYRARGSAKWQELSAKEVKVEVKSLLQAAPAQKDIRDIRGPKNFDRNAWLYIFPALCVLLIILAVFALIFSKKRKQERKTPPAPAHVVAYEALTALEIKDYIRKGRIKAYYTELSDIVRQYLENRFNIRAPEMTTEEFLIQVKASGALSPEHKALVRDFLMNCDLVKFARHQPGGEEAGMIFSSAKRLIDQTKQEAQAQGI